jgi:hypothetical protein
MQENDPEYLTPQQVAEKLNISLSTVMRRFADEPGVVDIGPKSGRDTRPHRVLRIPRGVLLRVLHERRVR